MSSTGEVLSRPGGPLGAVEPGPWQIKDKSSGGGAGDSNPAMIASAYASRDAQIVQSNNNLLAMQTQAAVTQLGILQNSRTSRLQTMAWMTERMDSHDVSLQIATENARLHAHEETDRHVEAMVQCDLEGREIEIRDAT